MSLVEEKGGPITSFKIRVTHDLAEFADLWPRTDRSGSAYCYVFQCADFLEVWCDTIGKARGTQAIFVAVLDDFGQPMVLLPLGIERQCGVRVLRFLDGGVCDYNAPILFAPVRVWSRDAIERAWQELIRVLPRFDIALFDKMPADICGMPNPLIHLGRIPFAVSGYVTSIASSWEQYKAQRLPYRRNSDQQRRKLAKVGRVVFTVAETLIHRQRIVQVMMEQKSRRCIETGEADELDLPGYRQYYVAMTKRFTWPGPLLVTALELDGKVLSTSWSLIFNKRLLWMVTTFAGGDWRRLSPGRILLEDLLEWSFSNGIAIFDFGIGDESYKVGYSDEKIALYQSNIPVTIIGKAYQVARNAKIWRLLRPLAKRAINKIRLFPSGFWGGNRDVGSPISN